MEMTREQQKAMMQEVQKNEDDSWPAIEVLVATIKKDASEKDIEESKKAVLDRIYNCLSQSYEIESKWLDRVYGPLGYVKPSKRDIDRLLYSADGKSLEDRINEHFEDFSEELHETREQDRDRKVHLLNKLHKIVFTENVHMVNHLMYYNFKEKAKAVIVVGGIGCETCDCEAKWGVYPIDQFSETYDIPPFHSHCGCGIIVVT